MSAADWIIVGSALVGGVVAGMVASRIVNAVIGAEHRPPALRNAARALSSLAYWVFVVIGLIVALGVVSPSALEQLPRDVIKFLPRLLGAAIILIAANVLASFAEASVAPALGRMSPGVQRRILQVTRTTIICLAVLLAVRQLGFDTTVINLAVAAVFFGIAGALMLLVALGGREVATEVASSRALRRLVDVGDRVRIGATTGTVVAVHPTAVELLDDGGRAHMVPSSHFVAETFTIEQRAKDRGRA